MPVNSFGHLTILKVMCVIVFALEIESSAGSTSGLFGVGFLFHNASGTSQI